MSGYTPLFDTVLDGTLCGKWPHTGIWTCLLSQADRHGHIDKHPNLLAAKIGVPLELLLSCIADFMKPDPGSRTPESDGRRLELLDPNNRDWGWRVVNHQKYRDRARKASYDSERTASGKDAARKAVARDESRRVPTRPAQTDRVPTCPDASRDVPLSDSDTNSDTDLGKETTAALAASTDPPGLLDFKLAYPARAGGQPWRRAIKAINARLAEGYTWNDLVEGARRYHAYCKAAGKVGTEFVMQAATFVGPERRFLERWDPPPTKADRRLNGNLNAAAEAKRKLFGSAP